MTFPNLVVLLHITDSFLYFFSISPLSGAWCFISEMYQKKTHFSKPSWIICISLFPQKITLHQFNCKIIENKAGNLLDWIKLWTNVKSNLTTNFYLFSVITVQNYFVFWDFWENMFTSPSKIFIKKKKNEKKNVGDGWGNFQVCLHIREFFFSP